MSMILRVCRNNDSNVESFGNVFFGDDVVEYDVVASCNFDPSLPVCMPRQVPLDDISSRPEGGAYKSYDVTNVDPVYRVWF